VVFRGTAARSRCRMSLVMTPVRYRTPAPGCRSRRHHLQDGDRAPRPTAGGPAYPPAG
jgi:hypothetical protein